MEWKYTQWTILKKEEEESEAVSYHPSAISQALSWFFAWNGLEGNHAEIYDFLEQFLGTVNLDGDYGSLFFVTSGDGLELQKFVGRQGFHDDHTSVTSVYFVPATETGSTRKDWPINVPANVEWKALEEDSKLYRKEWFAGCKDVKVFIEEEVVMGAYYGKVTNPIFLITDVPGISGTYLVKLSHLSD